MNCVKAISVLAVIANGLELCFGSCAGMFGVEYEKIWKTIQERNPEAFIWLGDVIYADDMPFPLYFVPTTEANWRKKYEIAKNTPGYKELRENVRILGVWDDHDYGANNENRHFVHKVFSKKLFLEFLDEPKDSVRYQREGIYESYDFSEGSIKVRVILLDDRTYLDSKSEDADVLGEIQWQWLEEQMSDNKIDLFLIMNGIQINGEDRLSVSEQWFPKSRKRLLKLLQQHPNSILASGDVHHSEIFEAGCNGYMVLEFTSSGLTHSVLRNIGSFGVWLFDFLYPYTTNVTPRIYSESFGSIVVKENGKVMLTIVDPDGKEVFEKSLWIKELWNKRENEWYCELGIWRRRAGHWSSMGIVFVIPTFVWGLAWVIFFRKYSNSY